MKTESMKAIVIHEYGPPEVLRYQELPDPVPRTGEIRIKVHAATVNRVLDVSLRAGKEAGRGAVLPLIPGVDCAGTVDAIGPQVSRWHVGDRVAAAGIMPLNICAEDGGGYNGPRGMMGIKRPGGFAELVAVSACAAVALPEALDFHRAAVVMRHVPTAWNLLVHVAELKFGETVLIMGAGGNLGTIGIQIAKNVIGARVIAAAGSDERVTLGKKLGADHGINYATQNIFDEIMTFTGGKGVDVPARGTFGPSSGERGGAKGRCAREYLEREAESLTTTPFGIGHIAIGCALSYLDFRYAGEDWRKKHLHIANWHASFAARPSVRATKPVDE